MDRKSPCRVRVGILAALMISAAGYAAASEAQDAATHPAASSPDQTTGSVYHYAWYAGSSFVPFDTSAQFGYKGAGCIYRSGGGESRFAHKVMLPQGANVQFVRLYAFDNSTSSVRAYFTTYDAAGGYHDLATTASENGDYGSTLTSQINHVVDHYDKAINVVVNLGDDTTPDLAFCGVRIAYSLAPDDVIFKNGFD